MFLHRKPVTVARRTRPRILSVRTKNAGLARVGEICRKDFRADALAKVRILHGKEDLHAFVEIAWHPVCAAKIDFRLAAIFKVKDAAVFQKTADDATHPDATAH